MDVVAVSGSLRKRSYNTALLRAAQKLAPEDLHIELLEIGTLPLFNQDTEETDYPSEVTALRTRIKAADGVLVATPEFNRTPPAPLKNFLDWSSRPENEPLPWAGKPVGVLGSSNGLRGASFAQYDVRRVMGYFNAHVMGQPEFYLAKNVEKFDDELNLTDEKTAEVLKKFLTAFKTFVAQ